MYNFEKQTCDLCDTAKTPEGFILDWDGGGLCPACHKERLLRELFEIRTTEQEVVRVWVI